MGHLGLPVRPGTQPTRDRIEPAPHHTQSEACTLNPPRTFSRLLLHAILVAGAYPVRRNSPEQQINTEYLDYLRSGLRAATPA